MSATVIKLSIQRMVCTGCGAETNAACNCGKPYVAAAARAAAAVAANPEKSDRALAKEAGVSDKTVAKARKSTAGNSAAASTADGSAVAKRTGKDGRTRSMPKRRNKEAKKSPPAPDPFSMEEEYEAGPTPEERWQVSARNFAGEAIAMQALWRRLFGDWEKFSVPSDVAVLAQQAAEAWTQVASKLTLAASNDQMNGKAS